MMNVMQRRYAAAAREFWSARTSVLTAPHPARIARRGLAPHHGTISHMHPSLAHLPGLPTPASLRPETAGCPVRAGGRALMLAEDAAGGCWSAFGYNRAS
jgi:hypothetical protein